MMLTLTRQDIVDQFLPCAPDGCDWSRARAKTESLVPDGFNFFIPLHIVKREMGKVRPELWAELVFEAESEGRLCRPCGNTVYLAVGFP